MNNFNILNLIFAIFLYFIFSSLLSAQCPGSRSCNDAIIYCSLDALNGLTCDNLVGEEGICRPLCARGDCGYSTCKVTWWGFVAQGGLVTFTLTYGPCVDTDIDFDLDGLLWGISGDCRCQQEICCTPSGHPIANGMVFQANLEPCKIYYLWVSGFEDDICDFTFSNSGGATPILQPLGYINNEPSGIIQPICKGECNYKFKIEKPKGTCIPTNYEWYLDGNLVGNNNNEIALDFPEEGDFVICVKAYIGNSNSGSVCSEVGPRCATIKVRRLPDKIGVKRTLCYEATLPSGFKWHSQLINSSGFYHQELKDSKCCLFDSVVEFIVLPEPIINDVFYITCDNKPFYDILNHRHYPCLNRQEISFYDITDPFNCDSTIRLTAVNVDFSPSWSAKCFGNKTEIAPNIKIINPCQVGEAYEFYYRWYKMNDPTRTTISKEERILVDSLDEEYCIEITVHTRLDTALAICSKTFCESINESQVHGNYTKIQYAFCDSATVNGKTYFQSSVLTQNLQNRYGCDSIVNTEIEIKKSSQARISQSACDSIVFNNVAYKQSGKFKQMFQAATGCDSTLNLDLEIGKTKEVEISDAGCDSVVVNKIVYRQSGVFKQVLQTTSGCDSILNLDLRIQLSSQTDISKTDCDSVVINGHIYKISGDYTQAYQSINGCDSILRIHVNITNSNLAPLEVSGCDSVTINKTQYTQTGKYSQQLISANGCDSILNIDLTIFKSNSANVLFNSCDSAQINGQKYYQSGNYTQWLKTVDQCDSILNLEVRIQSSSETEISQSDCDSVVVNGQSYTQTGNYMQILKNGNQCDSVLTIHFTRLSSSITDLNFNSCDSLKVNGKVYKQSGNYTQMLTNSNQCDSILNLNVRIHKSEETDIKLAGCDSVLANGRTFKQTGKYSQLLTSSNGCDSVLNLDISIKNSAKADVSITSCDSIHVNGQTYRVSGDYTQYLKTVAQCDSILNIKANVLNSSMSRLSQNACDSAEINGIKYYASGHYVQNVKNTNGCDSTIQIELTIKPGNNMTIEAGKDTSICQGELVRLNGVFTGQANYVWQSNDGSFDNANSATPMYYPAEVGDNRVYLRADAGCGELVDSLTIHVLRNQIVKVVGDTLIEPCKEIKFTATGGTNYIWTPASMIDCLDPPCSRVKLKPNETYRFTVTTDGPCPVPARLNLSLAEVKSDIYLPNAFSPNGDNINDQFLPVFNCELVDYYNLQIFDRWGNLIFETDNKSIGWNGKYENVNMIPGVYTYIIQYKVHNTEKKVKTGDVTLIR